MKKRVECIVCGLVDPFPGTTCVVEGRHPVTETKPKRRVVHVRASDAVVEACTLPSSRADSGEGAKEKDR